MTPPVRPQPPLIDDGYFVEPEPLETPVPNWFAWLVVGACIGFVAGFVVGRVL